MVKVLFFAALKDALGTGHYEVELNDSNMLNVAQLKQLLIVQQPDWAKPLSKQNLVCAVNQVMVDEQHPVSVNDEVAFFPPVTGG